MQYADLILVMLDPIGQAMTSRTMEVVSALNQSPCHSKVRYYLTKADTITRQDDLHKVLTQTTLNLKTKLHDDHGFELPVSGKQRGRYSGKIMREINAQA